MVIIIMTVIILQRYEFFPNKQAIWRKKYKIGGNYEIYRILLLVLSYHLKSLYTEYQLFYLHERVHYRSVLCITSLNWCNEMLFSPFAEHDRLLTELREVAFGIGLFQHI